MTINGFVQLEYVMKRVMKQSWIIFLLFLTVAATGAMAQNNEGETTDADKEKLVRRNWSLFSESYKMNDLYTAKRYGWTVRELQPERFKTLHPKMINIYDSLWSKTDDEAVKAQLADTVMFLIDDAMKLFPSKLEYYLLKRGYYFERLFKDKKQEAIADYESGIKSDYTTGDLWYLDRLAVLYSEEAEKAEDLTLRGEDATPSTTAKSKAIEVLQAILLRDPNNARAQSIMKSLVSNPEEYVALLRDSYYADSENRQKLYELANAYYEQLADYDSAAVYFEKLTKIDGTVNNYWERLAASYMYLSKYDAAIAAYTKVTTLDESNKESWINLASAQKEVGKLSGARSSAEKALQIAPDWGAPHMLIGQVYEATASKCVEGTRGGWGKMKIQDKAMYSLAQTEYRKAAKDPNFAEQANGRIRQIASLTPTAEDLFRNGVKKGSSYSLNSGCYSWINRSVVLSY
jgi:tetratricopeptide (TPR) repeat protein